jgi:ABC-type multidrug transport system fused ATPase/permease subunit
LPIAGQNFRRLRGFETPPFLETFSYSSVSNGLAWDSFEVRLLAGRRPMLEARGLTKYYGSMLAVQSIDFCLEPGQVLGYLGPNGSGKSTTVKMLIGLLEPTDGQVLFNGKNVQQDLVGYRKHLGYVPEEANLYPYLTGY